jgi:tRNA (mo5U34)-methyltransferase
MKSLRDQIVALGPWHMDIQVTPDISTRVWVEESQNLSKRKIGPGLCFWQSTPRAAFENMSFYPPHHAVAEIVNRVYGPSGLRDRSILDCACNAGGYAFAAKEFGAGEVFGFDAREHWIRQARWLQQNRRPYPTDRMRFEVGRLDEVMRFADIRPSYDVTFFMGIFYHLADPLAAVKLVADMTRELLIFGTATRNGMPDNLLVLQEENPEHHLSGLNSLNWLPTGPLMVRRILHWAGFPVTRVRLWQSGDVFGQPPDCGHLEILAARDEAIFARYDAAAAETR